MAAVVLMSSYYKQQVAQFIDARTIIFTYLSRQTSSISQSLLLLHQNLVIFYPMRLYSAGTRTECKNHRNPCLTDARPRCSVSKVNISTTHKEKSPSEGIRGPDYTQKLPPLKWRAYSSV
ncbi:hypothetical protein AVEN_14287-1 [Araneus ventricosus]|uniref:Uncharacterized protein n=1 Tax=Araneus ventricosus TaxID=182803 RepID=A0A4Y2X4W3_ARAVE|nr:hypothetical protein AVEN_14287-1 [Araneus ventricosus]